MQNFMATGNPLWLVPGGGTFIGNMLSNGGAEYTMFDLNNPSNLSDSDKSVLSTETTYELGYSGKIGNKLSSLLMFTILGNKMSWVPKE